MLNEGYLHAGSTGRKYLFAAGVGLAVVVSRTLRGVLIGNLFNIDSSTLIGRVKCSLFSAVGGVDAFATLMRLTR